MVNIGLNMIKKTIRIITILGVIVLFFKLISPQVITPPDYLDEIALKLENQYDDTSLYDANCEENAIFTVIIYQARNKKYIKCEEWIEKRNKCIALHPEYKEKVFKNISEICVKKEEK